MNRKNSSMNTGSTARTILTRLCIAAIAVLALSGIAGAQQIRLTNGRVIQGEIVGLLTDDGFTFKLADTGGEAFFRWSQINEDDAKRIRKIEDPDANIPLVIYVKGDRLNLIFGEPLEGTVEQFPDHFEVTNLRNNHRRIDIADVIEGPDGYQKGVDIDARVVKSPAEILKYQTDLIKPENAQQHYALARLAEKLGLYTDAKSIVDSCLAASPAPRLQSLADTMRLRLEELIKQQAFLDLLVRAKKDADKDSYVSALAMLDDLAKKKNPAPPEEVLIKLKEVRDEIDLDYSKFVIQDWFTEMSLAARTHFSKKENRDCTLNEGMTYARNGIKDDIKSMVALKVSPVSPGVAAKDRPPADPNVLKDVERRFRDRLVNPKLAKLLKTRTASFTKDGWYQNVGGNLPVAGKKKPAQQQNNGFPIPGGNNNNRNNGNRNNGNGNRFPGSSIDPSEFEKAMKAIAESRGGFFTDPDADAANDLQDKPKEGGKPQGGGAAGGGDSKAPPGDSADAVKKAIEDIIKKATGGGAPDPNAGGAGGPTARKEDQYKDDDAQMKVPDEVKPMTEWWDALSPGARASWCIAFHARDGGILDYLGRSYYTVKYR